MNIFVENNTIKYLNKYLELFKEVKELRKIMETLANNYQIQKDDVLIQRCNKNFEEILKPMFKLNKILNEFCINKAREDIICMFC